MPRQTPASTIMGGDLSDSLLARLTEGDAEAAERVFRAYEPILRVIVRRQLSPNLQSKFDSVDVVQSVWADVLQGFRSGNWRFPDADRLRAFLVRMTRNRFLDRVRHHEHVLEHEAPLLEEAERNTPSPDPSPSAEASANDLWQEMLSMCSPAHRELLRLKRQGLPLPEIAARTGMHESSIRRILYDVASRFARRQQKRDEG